MKLPKIFGKKDIDVTEKKDAPKGIGHYVSLKLPYQFEKGIEHVGDFDYYLKTYMLDPILKMNIDLPCRYVFKDGYDFISSDNEKKERVEKFFDDAGFANVGFLWLKDSKIYGTGFLEVTKTSLIPRDPRTMFIETDLHGKITEVIQKPEGKTEEDYIHFKPNEIIVLKNNSLSDNPYGISDIESVSYLISFLKDQGERDVGAMLNKYAGEKLLVKCGSSDNPFSETKINEVREYFSKLKIGEDVIYSADIDVKTMAHESGNAEEFIKYLKYIINVMGMGMNVPISSVLFGDTSGDAAEKCLSFFESYIKYLQTSIEHVLNTELIPQIIGEKSKVKIKFKALSINQEWIRAKKDLIDVQTGIKDINEVRMERGLSYIENKKPETTPSKIPIESKGPVAKRTIGGNLTGVRTPKNKEEE